MGILEEMKGRPVAKVECRPVVMQDAPDAKLVWLVVGNQSFQIADAWEDPEAAELYADNLRIALERAGAIVYRKGVLQSP